MSKLTVHIKPGGGATQTSVLLVICLRCRLGVAVGVPNRRSDSGALLFHSNIVTTFRLLAQMHTLIFALIDF